MSGAGHYNTREEQVECAIARGRSIEWMAKHLGATLQEITEAQERIDRSVEDDQWVRSRDSVRWMP